MYYSAEVEINASGFMVIMLKLIMIMLRLMVIMLGLSVIMLKLMVIMLRLYGDDDSRHHPCHK